MDRDEDNGIRQILVVLICHFLIGNVVVTCQDGVDVANKVDLVLVFAAGLTDSIRLDRYLFPHFRYYMREVRVVAYSQFLESYKSVTMDAMAKAFGVSVNFLDL
jgi:hypothetical protein